MSRLAVPVYVPANISAFDAVASTTDKREPDFLDRLVKYIPAEAVAFFVTINVAVIGQFKLPVDGSKADMTTLTGVFWFVAVGSVLLGLVVTPFYLYSRRDKAPAGVVPQPPWIINTVLATIAFPIWAYAVGGALFIGLGWFQPLVATFLVGAYTLVAPLVRPTI